MQYPLCLFMFFSGCLCFLGGVCLQAKGFSRFENSMLVASLWSFCNPNSTHFALLYQCYNPLRNHWCGHHIAVWHVIEKLAFNATHFIHTTGIFCMYASRWEEIWISESLFTSSLSCLKFKIRVDWVKCVAAPLVCLPAASLVYQTESYVHHNVLPLEAPYCGHLTAVPL